MDMLKQVRYEDMTEEQQMLIDIMGMDAFMELVQTCGGAYVYIPKEDNLIRPIRNRTIRKEFNGRNFKELAVKYGLASMQIRNIVKEKG